MIHIICNPIAGNGRARKIGGQIQEKLQARGALKNLKGLLYFTDGDGAYPKKKTPYETAFVFTNREALNRKLPEWIVPLCLDP